MAGVLVEPVVATQRVDRVQDQRERRAELVAGVGEEGCLRAVQLGELLGPQLFGTIAAGQSDVGGDARSHQGYEAAVALVHRTIPVEARHQEPHRRLTLL